MALTAAQRSANYRAKDVEAYRKKKREYARTPEQRKKQTAANLAWRARNREYYNEWARQYHQRRKSQIQPKARGWRLKFQYGITEEQYDAMFRGQNGMCAICGTPPQGGIRSKYLHVDHDHGTGSIRGLLCVSCNTKLDWTMKYKSQIDSYLSHRKIW